MNLSNSLQLPIGFFFKWEVFTDFSYNYYDLHHKKHNFFSKRKNMHVLFRTIRLLHRQYKIHFEHR